LGIASYPKGTSLLDATMFHWLVADMRPSGYRLGYSLSELEERQIAADHEKYARSVGHERVDAEVFKWAPPPECGTDLRCPFEQLMGRNRPAVLPLAERFRARAASAGLTSAQLASIVVGFVQSIRYEVPREVPFGVLPPALVASEKRGDCDSKALLALMILRELGIDGRLVSSQAHRHSMLGVAIPSSGKYFEHAGRRFAFTECTAVGAPIGFMDPRFSHPDDWRVVPVRI
jgi:transglutaminase-like putative cysteine protease